MRVLVTVAIALLLVVLGLVGGHAGRINELEINYGRVDERLIKVIENQKEMKSLILER